MALNIQVNPTPASPLIMIAGPTATGKTGLAVELARRIKGEIISADSMQVYRGLVIGTAQPTPEECGDIPYHLVNEIDPSRAWSVADWLKATRAIVRDIHSRGKTAIIAGGTGLYFKTLTQGLFSSDGAKRNPRLRRELEAEWEEDHGEKLWTELSRKDPRTAERLHPNDRLRVVRAHEVMRSTGSTMSELRERARRDFSPPPAVRIVLRMDREPLYERIDSRVLKMMEAGFEKEVRGLLESGAQREWPGMRALGYPQMTDAIEGLIPLDEAIRETQKLSRRYAKQQIVLYRQWPGAAWIDAGLEAQRNAELIELMLELYRDSGSNRQY